jgi:CPA2 family monovalent cation:H+ antiporter-2
MHDTDFLQDLLVVYAFGAGVVYLFYRLRQPPIVGFLVTGMVVGPYGLSLIAEESTVHVLAEIGVMLLLFSLGLEFSLKKLLKLRLVALGTGSMQVLSTVGAAMLLGIALHIPLSQGIFLGFLVALSSTAVVLKMLLERGEMNSIQGRVSLGILLFQDFCIVPMLVIIPLLNSRGSIWIPLGYALVRAAVVIILVLTVARYLFPELLRRVTATRSKELFIITSITMFLGTAWMTSLAGLSLAVGSFLAGLILSESEYSQQIFSEIRPFRDTLNSLFFISIGMLVQPGFLWTHPGPIILLILSILIGKFLLVTVPILLTGLPVQIALLVGMRLAQIGEFSFVLLEFGSGLNLITSDWYQMILTAAVGTMMVTPVIFILSESLASQPLILRWGSLVGQGKVLRELETASSRLRDHVIICGFGVSGRNVARVLKLHRIRYLAMELNSEIISRERASGEPIYFGDCNDVEILAHAGIQEARVIVFAISDPFTIPRAVRLARQLNPDLTILARTKYVAETDRLLELGATEVVSEEFEATMELVTCILGVYNLPRDLVAKEIRSIRESAYGLFRLARSTVPRLRLSSEIDVFTETVEVARDSPICKRSIGEVRVRQVWGVSILGIIRDKNTVNNPGPEELIVEGDRLILSGTQEQLSRARKTLLGLPD